FACPAAELGIHDRIQVLRADKFVKHANVVVQQLKAHVDLRVYADAVLGDGVIGLGRGLQSQGVDVELVPGPNDVKAFVPQFAGVEERSAPDKTPAVEIVPVKSLPKNADTAAGNRNHDVGEKNGGRQ